MATIYKEILLDAAPEVVWDALKDYGALHERLVVGFVTDARMEGDDRVVTFFNGMVARERLVGMDEGARRLAYSVTESPTGFTHHMASAQVFAEGEGTRFVWITDCLPDGVAGAVDDFMGRGLLALKETLAPGP
ncbi:SRPBCC family protein [Actinomadura rudentiformis]|uniref:SRPBCC family protein n=1 Tax=Actinomadura rudentiformis TaxID=359158 RepID=A0A6H9YP42_9ACTN|nr:SRPBCC family protein [Actinomadura rudentiformis]KAB2349453.1 SRPBCC family protein [Actinomadura rudentiformis]